jgi:hypothetical protein
MVSMSDDFEVLSCIFPRLLYGENRINRKKKFEQQKISFERKQQVTVVNGLTFRLIAPSIIAY